MTVAAPKSPYADLIRELSPACDPRHVEAFMRLEYGTLDHLSREAFTRQVRIAEGCILEAGTRAAEDLCRSYGM